MTAAPTRFSRKLLAAVLAPLLAIALLEGLIRVAGIERKRGDPPVILTGLERDPLFPNRWDDELLWSMEPGRAFPWAAEGRWGDERVNAQGLRGAEVAPDKPAGTRRVLCLGDSCTFAFGVAETASYAHRLRRWLAVDEGGIWEVVNAGVPGYSLWQMARFFDLRGAALAPDVVVLYAGAWNDYAPANGAPDSVLADRVRASREGLGRLRLVQLARSLLPKPRAGGDGDASSLGPRVPPDEFERLLRSLDDACRHAGARLVAVVPPAPASTRRDYPQGEVYADAIRRVSRERSIHLVDVRDSAATRPSTSAPIFYDGIHPTEEGHRLIFESVAAAIANLPLTLAPPPAPGSIEPVELRKLTGSCHLRTGTPLVPADLSVLEEKDGIVSVPVPFELRFDDVPIPAQASFFADVAPGIARPDHPQGTVFRVSIRAPGAESRPVASRTYPANRPLFLVENVGADLAAFAGSSVTLVLECTGAATTVLLGNAGVHAWR